MTKLLILAALMLSVIGGLTLMSSSSPLAAQTAPATRSLDSSIVKPGAEVMVTVTIADDYAGSLAQFTEMLPDGFAYKAGTLSGGRFSGGSYSGGNLVVNKVDLNGNSLAGTSISYTVTASRTDGDYNFSGTLKDASGGTHTLADTPIAVSSGPAPNEVNAGNFDVVPAAALKGATVSGVGNPIESDPLEWDVSDVAGEGKATIENAGAVGDDFQIVEAGSNKYRLKVVNSGAPSLNGSQRISVDLTYDDDTTVILSGMITERDALEFMNDADGDGFVFTVPANVAKGTPIGSFKVSGRVVNDDGSKEPLDGIITNDVDAEPFDVRDGDMTIFKSKEGLLDVRDYKFKLTVNGDAGIAKRVIRTDVTVRVTASNQKHTAPDTFEPPPVRENMPGAGLVSATTVVGDASVGVMRPDNDELKYSIEGDVPFEIHEETGVVTVGPDDIGGDAEDGNIEYNFDIRVSDDVSANDAIIAATVTVDVNDPVMAKTDDLPDGVSEDGGTYSFSTDPVAGTANGVPLLDLSMLVDAGEGDDDTLTYVDDISPTMPLLVDGSGMLILTHVPRAVEDKLSGDYEFSVDIDDGYNSGNGADENITIKLTVNVKPKPAQSTPSLTANIDENMTGPVQAALADLDSSDNSSLAALQAEIEASGGVTYVHTGGSNGGGPGAGAIFSVDSATGAVMLDVEQDAETLTAMPTVVFQVDRMSDRAVLGIVFVSVRINNVNEAPVFGAAPELSVSEKAQVNTNVGDPITAADEDTGDTVTYSIEGDDAASFKVMPATGQIQVKNNGLMLGDKMVTLVATDSEGLTDELALTIAVIDENDAPSFDSPYMTEFKVDEQDEAKASDLHTYNATDADGTDALQGVKFVLTDSDDARHFMITNNTNSGVHTGVLSVKAGANLDVDAAGMKSEYELLLAVCDKLNACSEKIDITVTIKPMNDNAPVINSGARATVPVFENAARDMMLESYMATDADGDAISYTISGPGSSSFYITDEGNLMTLESLDADSMTPCGSAGCMLKVTASDGEKSDTKNVTVSVQNAEDSVSTFTVTKANPVPGVSMGDPDSALADTKTSKMGIAERPADQPATGGKDVDAPVNFVSADWGSWGTVLRVAVTAQSPDAACGEAVGDADRNNNQCVYIDVESDSAGNKFRLEAYRSAKQENLFVAAVMLVEKDPTDDGDGKDGDRNNPVYKHDAGPGVVRLEADEEDEVIFRLVGSTAPPIAIDVENENPEFNNFAPAHESAFDDGDVEYTFTITDPVSGIPEPEDLAGDNDGDGDYMPLVALIATSQCHTKDMNDKAYSKVDSKMTAGNDLWCKSTPEIRQVVDDKDFDEIDDGFEVETKIVLPENQARYVTFIVCDNAGNCAMYTPDENKEKEALAEITIDTEDPDLIEARTGVAWDSTDSKYDDDSTFIQLLFNDLTALDPTSVEADDFDIEGHTIKAVHWYDVSDTDDDTAWGDDDDSTTPSRFAKGGTTTKRGHPLRQSIRNSVFIELEDELAPDETPDVTIVPNGVMDSAGNEQDDDDVEADDWIAPSFTVVSMVSPRTPEGSSNQLAGDGDEVVITLTSDERIQQTRPLVTVTYVNAPKNCVNTVKSDDYARGEIKTDIAGCGKSATGGTLGKTFERVSNTEWIVTVDEPNDTGYYNIHIEGNDRSEQRNKGSEGIAAGSIATKFFERDGDVNSDDAHYFQGDINLSNPGVRVSGTQIEETEPTLEFKTPLFVELDFTRPYIDDCAMGEDKKYKDANCYAESDEYAKDSFDAVTVTSFTLNGTDMTDMVKTTDDETFLVSIENISIGDHEIEIMAVDQAGNTLDKALSVEFEVEERDDFSKRLNPGWNLVSLPGEPADSDISVVFGADVEVRTVYTYNPIIPGGWMVAVRETASSEWQGDLKEITARQGYWVLSDAIQDWDVSIPRLAGGAVGTGTPIQPPVIALYAGWNLVPVIDVTGNFSGSGISATAYLQSLDDGLDLARVLGFDTITNTWSTIMAPEGGSSADTLEYGKAYWVFVRQAASLVPGN